MAKITLKTNNSEEIVNGKMTFKISKIIDDQAMEDIVCYGKLATHKYFEEIKEIKTDRFILKGINVTDETFGTNDFNILYDFEASDWEIIENCLSEETISKIEEEEYKNDE